MPSLRLAGPFACAALVALICAAPAAAKPADGTEAHRPAGEAGGGLPLPAAGEGREEDPDDARDRHGRHGRAGLLHRQGRDRRLRSPVLLRRLSRRHHGGHPGVGAVPGLGPAPRVCAVRTEGGGLRHQPGRPASPDRADLLARPAEQGVGRALGRGHPARQQRRPRVGRHVLGAEPVHPGGLAAEERLEAAQGAQLLPRRDARQVSYTTVRSLTDETVQPQGGKHPTSALGGRDQRPDPEGVSRAHHHAHRHRARLGHVRGVRGRGRPQGRRPQGSRAGLEAALQRLCHPFAPGLDEATTTGCSESPTTSPRDRARRRRR